jgi:hypothetical protein
MKSIFQSTRSLAAVYLLLVLGCSPILSVAFAQSSGEDAPAESASYTTSYQVGIAGVTGPVTVEAENHLYRPGDDVKVVGFVWIDLVQRIEALEIISIEAEDPQGNIIAREEALIGEDGKYTATFSLLDSASEGTYTVRSKVELEADALGLVEAITSASLQSSVEFVVAEPVEHRVAAEGQEFTVEVASNSGITDFKFSQQDKKLSFLVEGNDGTTGVAEVRIPKALLSGNMTVLIDQNIAVADDVLLKSDTASEAVFEVNYKHSIHRIEFAGTSVVPEFPVALLVMATTIGAMVAASAISRRRGKR